MTSSDREPGPMPGPEDGTIPGKPMTTGQIVLDKGAQMMQSLKPISKISQHVCTFALYSHDMTRQIETHHYLSRVNEDFWQCPVFDTDDQATSRLIGVEYIVSEKTFDSLPPEEQKLWHSHAYELLIKFDFIFKYHILYQIQITSGLWINPRVPGVVEKSELQTFAKTFGKFWCTWQVDRGDKLPLGAPALMVSPQSESTVSSELVQKRDEKYDVSSESLITSRADIKPSDLLISYADHWRQSGKGFAIDIREADQFNKTAPFP